MSEQNTGRLVANIMQDLLWASEDLEEFVGEDGDECYMEVRLQLTPEGDFQLHFGDPSYDQDHRGFWGASSVGVDLDKDGAREVAKDLIDQVADHRAIDRAARRAGVYPGYAV